MRSCKLARCASPSPQISDAEEGAPHASCRSGLPSEEKALPLTPHFVSCLKENVDSEDGFSLIKLIQIPRKTKSLV